MTAPAATTPSEPGGSEPVSRPSLSLLGIIGASVLALTMATGVMHDHAGVYFVQWSSVLTGYAYTSNDYGPLHNTFALFFAIAPLLPKVVFATLALTAGWVLLDRGRRTDVALPLAVTLAVFVLNPVVVVSTYVYGQNDIVAATAIAFALAARADGRLALAGVFVGIAALEKFFPLAIAGFLALDGNRVVRLRVIGTAVGTFAAGMASAVLIWGVGVFTPILWAEARTPKMLSILQFFTCHPALVGGEQNVQLLVDVNVAVMCGATALAFLGLLWIGATWRAAAAIGCVVLLVSYKVGHPQFYVTWLVLLGWLLVDGRSGAERSVAIRLVPVAALVGLFQILYVTGFVGSEGSAVRCYASVPFLAAVLASLVAAVRVLPRAPGVLVRVSW